MIKPHLVTAAPRIVRKAALLIAAGLVSVATTAAPFPEKPIRIIAPFPPGNSTDAVARAAARKLEEVFKQPVVVDNRPGAGGSIGTELASKASPDGYTLLAGSSGTLAINPGLFNLSYQTERDFTPIAQLAVVPLFLAVTNTLAARDAASFVALVKSRPGSFSYGSNGNGTTTHIMMESFRKAHALDIVHVPYKGSGPALADLVSGQIQAVFDTGTTLLPLSRDGKLRILAVASARRIPVANQVPTFAESGLGNFDAPAWVGLVAPRGTPPEVIQAIHRALAATWLSPDVRSMAEAFGGEAVITTPTEFATFIGVEVRKWGSMIRDSGAKVD
jgi:tripartite-type tricarboxylate transporter receptor subunit TctC